MPRTVSFAWAKPVNNLGTHLVETRGLLSPAMDELFMQHEMAVNKSFISPLSYTVFLTHLYTAIFGSFNLLNAQLYPVSTASTIKKMKEKRKELI